VPGSVTAAVAHEINAGNIAFAIQTFQVPTNLGVHYFGVSVNPLDDRIILSFQDAGTWYYFLTDSSLQKKGAAKTMSNHFLPFPEDEAQSIFETQLDVWKAAIPMFPPCSTSKLESIQVGRRKGRSVVNDSRDRNVSVCHEQETSHVSLELSSNERVRPRMTRGRGQVSGRCGPKEHQ
jgi:hypothetical protein